MASLVRGRLAGAGGVRSAARYCAVAASDVKTAIALKTSVTETEGVASKPVLPTHAPERGARDRISAPGICRGDAHPLSALRQTGARSPARRVLPYDGLPSQGGHPAAAAATWPAGYDRYSSRAAWAVLERLYGLLRLHHNFFRPVRKLRSKRRVGSKVVKRYDAAQTPYQRVLAAGGLPVAQRQTLAAQVAALDPIALARDIQQTLDVLWKLADTRAPRQEAARG